MKRIGKILIANRGEIAVRIIRTLRKMGIRSVAVYSHDEKNSLHANLADESYLLNGEKLSETYLNIAELIRVARLAGVDAVHPGYGFLSENENFAEAVNREGFVFIGPSPSAIRVMGNKYEARAVAKKLNIPLIKGIEGDSSEIFSRSQELQYPVLIKAAAGGGGKAMRIAGNRGELVEALEVTSREAYNYFGDKRLYAENYYENVRHIELQLLVDNYGKVVVAGERDCSIQRRYQKVIEETPSVFLREETRRKMIRTAEKIAAEIGYTGAGTIEYLVDTNQNFFFLEMNTRIQVEHPITEMVTGLDLVQLQVEIASGKPLEISTPSIHIEGHAIEGRIYAENPAKNFLPSPGYIYDYKEPDIKGLRIDSSIEGPTEIHSRYDPMISKLIVHGSNRKEAIELLTQSLENYVVNGTLTNRELLLQISKNKDFKNNEFSTTWLEEMNQSLNRSIKRQKMSRPVNHILAAWLGSTLLGKVPQKEDNIWKRIGYWRQQIRRSVIYEGEQYDIFIYRKKKGEMSFSFQAKEYNLRLVKILDHEIMIEVDGKILRTAVTAGKSMEDIILLDGYEYRLKPLSYLPEPAFLSDKPETGIRGERIIKSPLHGRISRLHATTERKVIKGELLFTLDAMKIENKILAPVDGIIKAIKVNEGDQVEINQAVIILDDSKN